MPGILRVEWKGISGSYPSKIISFIRAQRLVERRCLSYLYFIRDTSIKPPPMDFITLVQEFPDVFLCESPSVPPDRDIDFAIDFESGTKPISIPSYYIDPAELKELQDISDESDGIIAFIEARYSLVEQIRAHQFNVEKLCLIRDKVLRREAEEVAFDCHGVLRIKGRMCVPKMGELTRWILEEAHCSRYSIHQGAPKMSSVISGSQGCISKDAYSYLEADQVFPLHSGSGKVYGREYVPDKSHVISHKSVDMGPHLTFEEEPIAILDMMVWRLSTKEITSVRVQWKHRSVGEATWETEYGMRVKYPQLFEASGTLLYFMFEDENAYWWII
ncbi:uncharacterized protein [Solanum lycopersicum]|uniref:uncharacterized protein n=1 Tax=Solanum lycopersicum TaxID=4081 RepID=UPI003749F366